jgi:hypothetical protein
VFRVEFTAQARLALLDALSRADGHEVLFRGQFDAATRRITAIEPMAHGGRDRVMSLASYFKPGEFHIHSHPDERTSPSAADLDCAESLYALGVGFAVVNHDASKLHVVTLPRRVEATVRSRTRVWKVGRRMLTVSLYTL